MRKFAVIAILSLALSACETVQFKQLALYDAYAEPAPAEKVSEVIFEDAVSTMWNSLEDCGEFEVTQDVAHSGQSSIKISWDKGKGCEWLGFGNSFSNWTAADLSKDRFKKALSFYVRTQEKTAKAIPIVANLEDFGGGGSYYFIDANKYLYGLEMDTTWKQIIVPLWDFPVNDDEVDIRSIKQMKFQLEGAGALYLDDIRLIEYSKEQYRKMREEVEAMKPKGAVEQVVYTEGRFTDDAWGYENNRCQKLGEMEEGANRFIHWQYEAKDCAWAKWGINWNGWYQANFRGIVDQAKIQFRVKTRGESEFKVYLEDFRGHQAQVYKHPATSGSAGWQLVEIPLKDLDLKGKNFALDQIRQLRFEGQATGEVFLDDIKITGT